MSAPERAPFAFLDRRTFLRLIGGAAGLAGVSALGLARCNDWEVATNAAPVLTRSQRIDLQAVAETHFPPGGTPPGDSRHLELDEAFLRFLGDEPEDSVEQIKRALWLIDFGPVLFDGRLVRFTSLTASERREHWERWAKSDMLVRRKVATAFRKFFSMVHFDRPEVWPRIGYRGPRVEGARGSYVAPAVEGLVDLSRDPVPRSLMVDVCIVGSGAGGGTAAWALSAGLDVLVLEEGSDRSGPGFTQRDATMHDQLYMDRGGRTTDDMSVAILQGRTLGGGTVINACDVVATPDPVFQHWARAYGLTPSLRSSCAGTPPARSRISTQA